MRINSTFKVLLTFILILNVTFSFTVSTEAAKKISYLPDTNNIYTYNFFGTKYTNTFVLKDDNQYYWRMHSKGETYLEELIETERGLYDDDEKVLSYPIKKNKTWNPEGYATYKIISTNNTVQVKAGTFENVVVVKCIDNSEGEDDTYIYYNYYAPNVGLILIKENSKDTKFKTQKIEELINIENAE